LRQYYLWGKIRVASELIYAAIYRGAERVTELLDQGHDINARDENGTTALMHAFYSQRYDRNKVIEILIRRGANVSIKDHGVVKFGPGRVMSDPEGKSALSKVRKELRRLDPVRHSVHFHELKEIEKLLIERGAVE